MREGIEWYKKYANDPVDRPFQYIGTPYLALRHQFPLEAFENINLEEQNFEVENVAIPAFKFDPQTLGYVRDYRHGTTIPGFWPGNVREFGLLSYQDRNYMMIRDNKTLGDQDKQEALHAQGILSSYAWLFGQACYQGFSTFNDVTYPLTTQTIVTDGKFWSFYAYQLNTTLVHSDNCDKNPRYNQCWGTKEMQLFEKIEDNGKIQGLNEEVLTNLIQFYINQPKHRKDIEMKPYLGETEKKIADIEDDKRRIFLDRVYKHLMSNRPRHRLVPEIYSWEKIYKIDNKTKPLQPKRRFFELGINPFKRRLDEHQPIYIPRDLRPRGKKDRKKWEPTYYP
jgi:small subunit ribosomal protein S30